MSDFAIRAKNLGKCYRLYERASDRLKELLTFRRRVYHEPFWALQDLDLEIKKGECVGLVGVNGAGKSTTLKLLAGKLRATTGEIEVKGRLSSILELGTGFQPHLTGRQNAFVNALFLGQTPWETDRHVQQILDFAEIKPSHADQPLSTYSSGMQGRLAFAALTTLEPEVLILDEALATGDVRFAQKCNKYLRSLCRSGCTTIMASHDMSFLFSTCDRIVWIDKGRKRAEGPPADILPRYVDAQGWQPGTEEASRPRNVLLRIEAEEPALRPTFTFHCLEWLDSGDQVLGAYYPGDDPMWRNLLEASASFGFTPARASAGWGGVELPIIDGRTAGLNRSCSPDKGLEGAVYVTVPVPPAPHRLPAKLRAIVRKNAPCNAVLSLQVEGRFREIGRTGRAEANGGEWDRTAFGLGDAFTAGQK